jgi:hypothetical protein
VKSSCGFHLALLHRTHGANIESSAFLASEHI